MGYASFRLALGRIHHLPTLYHHTHDVSGIAMQQHDALLQKWLSESDSHTYTAEFRRYKETTDIFSAPTIWTDKALEVDAHVWWDYWGSGKKVLHDFVTRGTSQPVSIGSESARRCWKAYYATVATSIAPNETDLARFRCVYCTRR